MPIVSFKIQNLSIQIEYKYTIYSNSDYFNLPISSYRLYLIWIGTKFWPEKKQVFTNYIFNV